MSNILVLHGPNLNLLGLREPKLYGTVTLQAINQQLHHMAESAGIQIECIQSQSESKLIDLIHNAYQSDVELLLLNPAALTHTSIALRDALLATEIPFIEVHLSQPNAREPFRQISYFTDIALGTISGFGAQSYYLALRAAIERIRGKN